MNKILFFFLSLFLFVGPTLYAAAPSKPSPAATFISVKGKVTVGKKGTLRRALRDHKALQGETINVAKKASTTIQLFDGSTLDLMEGSKLTLKTLKKPSAKEKQIHFSLSFGSLFAHVKKLLTNSSSFEVEAGGVICGVRGTQFSVAYNRSEQKVDLSVLEGIVLARSGGESKLVGAGQAIEFLNGKLKLPKGPKPPPNSKGKKEGNGGRSAVIYPPNGKFIDPAAVPQDPNGSLSLGDLNGQFVNGIGVNGDNTGTNPSVAGGVMLNIKMHLGSQETVP